MPALFPAAAMSAVLQLDDDASLRLCGGLALQ
jgi:hypothetical protein